MAERKVSVTKIVAAPAQRIFALLADPAKHTLIDGSGTVKAARTGSATRLTLGATFGMDMKFLLPYRTTNRVVEFEEGRLIAWRHFGPPRWRWELRPLDEQHTEVTETFDYSAAPIPVLFHLTGMVKRNRRAMSDSLDRLAKMVSE